VTAADAEEVATRFVQFLETGEPPTALFTDDAFVDFTSPRWRAQAQGKDQVVALRRKSHPTVGRVPRWRCDPTPTGFVLELEEQWQDGGEQWYCREMFRADVRDASIAHLSVYCTGDSPRVARSTHARSGCFGRSWERGRTIRWTRMRWSVASASWRSSTG
jgi:hypothetical protein